MNGRFWERLAQLEVHPTKVKILERMRGSDEPLSPVILAKEFGLNVGHVGYHFRALHGAGFLELVDEKPVRGAVEHFYRFRFIPAEEPVIHKKEAKALAEHEDAITEMLAAGVSPDQLARRALALDAQEAVLA